MIAASGFTAANAALEYLTAEEAKAELERTVKPEVPQVASAPTAEGETKQADANVQEQPTKEEPKDEAATAKESTDVAASPKIEEPIDNKTESPPIALPSPKEAPKRGASSKGRKSRGSSINKSTEKVDCSPSPKEQSSSTPEQS